MLRRRILPTIAVLALGVAACDVGAPSGVAPDARRSLGSGRADAREWIAQGRTESIDTTTAIALGYLERLRLGFGSPFRLVDQALQDPRLSDSLRVRVGWALLARLLDGDAYEIEPAALDRAGLGRHDVWPGAGRHHLRLIGGTIAESRDPRAGEVAVRLAYGLAAAEGNLPAHAPRMAARAAALLRDRELAIDDLHLLLRAAASDSTDPLVLLRRWRAERRFLVEAPPSAPIPAIAELDAVRIGLRLAAALREQATRADESRPDRTAPPGTLPGLLGPHAAALLGASAESLNSPPQTPVALAARNYRKELLDPRLVDADEHARRRDLVEAGISEERFVARFAQLDRQPGTEVAPSLAALWAAVSLRTYAQEPVWFPGSGGPSARELEERYGLSIAFGEAVPAEWRPFYRKMLDQSLGDLRLVLPSLDLRGLRVVIDQDAPRQEGTLAMHDPRGRRLLLPPVTALGTVAHELAHDLDWQVALRRYRVRGDYATDRATRTRDTRLAMQLDELAAGASLDNSSERLASHARRPAEVFARSLDWFVAVSLAADGRVNGYLSSVQDDILTGYGTVRPPDVTGTAGKALISILDEVAPVYPRTREWFLRSYGPSRAITAYDLMRRVLEDPHVPEASMPIDAPADPATPEMRTPSISLDHVVRARDAALAEIDVWICRAPGAAYDRNLEIARRLLVIETAAARARGLARGHARSLAGPRAERWLARELVGAPLSAPAADSLLVAMLRPIAESVRDVVAPEPVSARSGFQLASPPAFCGDRPFGSAYAPAFSAGG